MLSYYRLKIGFGLSLTMFLVLTFVSKMITDNLVMKYGLIVIGVTWLILGMVMAVIDAYNKIDVGSLLTSDKAIGMLGYIKVMISSGMTFKRALYIYSRNTNKLRLMLYWLLPVMLLLVTTNVVFIVSGIGVINWVNILSMYSIVAVMLVFGLYRYQYLSKQMKGRPCLAGY